MELFEKNYRLLLEKTGIDIQGLKPDDNFVIEKTLKGDPTVRIGSRYIHSRHDPAGEARKIILSAIEGDFDCWVFGGLGLGYHVESFLELNSTAKAVIVEPEISFLAAAAKTRNLEKIINSDRIFLILSAEADAVSSCLNSLQCERIKYFQIRSEYELDPEYFELVKKSVSAYVSRKEINNNTLKRFGRLWVKNLSENLAEFSVSPGLVHLQSAFAGIPALIAAGGPGLDAVLPYLSKLREKFLIIAVDTSFSACVAAGAVPDILAVVDPQYWNSRHLDRCTAGSTILLSEPSTYSRIFRNFRNNGACKFFAGSVFPLGKYFENITFERGKIGAGGSVATSAWDLARQAGCSEAVFAGLDLGYPDRQTHFRGSFFEERAHTLSCRIRPASDMDFALITDASLIETEDSSGGKVLTDRRLIVYRQWFEEQLQMHDLKTSSLSRKGVKIRRMNLIGLDNLLSRPDIRAKIDKITDELKFFADKYKNDQGRKFLEKTAEGLKSLLNSLLLLKKAAEKGRRAAEKLLYDFKRTDGSGTGASGSLSYRKQVIKKLMAEIDEADREILSGAERSIAGFLLQDSIRKISAVTQDTDFESVIGRTLSIYTELENSFEFHIKQLTQAEKNLMKTFQT